MWKNIKEKFVHSSKEEIKKEVQKHAPEIFAVTTILMLGYLCVKINGKPVNVTVNVNGGSPWATI